MPISKTNYLERKYSTYVLHVARPSLDRFFNASKPALLQKFEPCINQINHFNRTFNVPYFHFTWKSL